MLDKDGYRLNVGIILANAKGKVFLAKRAGQDAWQFPQGGMLSTESPEEALYRELYEEVGLSQDQVRIVATSNHWFKYELPGKYLRQPAQGDFVGQKQKWFLLTSDNLSLDSDINLNAFDVPEFDDWRWVPYWEPLDKVIEFKRQVYLSALTEFEVAHSNLLKV